jgi:hypothetical protein
MSTRMGKKARKGKSLLLLDAKSRLRFQLYVLVQGTRQEPSRSVAESDRLPPG